MVNSPVEKELEKLAKYVKVFIDNKIAKKEMKPLEVDYLCWEVQNFSYKKDGSSSVSRVGSHKTKKSWFFPYPKDGEIISKSKQFNLTIKEIEKKFGKDQNCVHVLDSFIRVIGFNYLNSEKFECKKIIKNLLKDLKNEPIKCLAVIELEGITLVPHSIRINQNVLLRRVKKSDLEYEIPAYSHMHSSMDMHTPTSILRIEMLQNRGTELQETIRKVISILRLFKVGSVNYTSYKMNSESITGRFSETMSTNRYIPALEKYSIGREDVKELKGFFNASFDIIPKSFFAFGGLKSDYVSIAYNRYCDAMLEPGIIEKRIANVMMGLEAIFIKECLELQYRLSTRIGKFFSLIGHDPHKVREVIKDAYRIRSLFAHGEILDHKNRKKYETKYISINTLLNEILDYLRISIVLSVFMDFEKEKFIDMLDDSLVDKNQETVLANILTRHSTTFGVGIVKNRKND